MAKFVHLLVQLTKQGLERRIGIDTGRGPDSHLTPGTWPIPPRASGRRMSSSRFRRLERGARLDEGALGPAYAFARLNPGDPRPLLLIVHAHAQLGWMSDSVERYQRAYRADPTCRGDPQMLEDLLKAATHRVAGRNAAQAIRDIYGAEAIPAVEKAIARGAGDRDGDDRLDHLRDSLTE